MTTASEPARVSTVQAVKKAVEQFSALTGRSPESVVGARWVDDHWAVRLEVVESRRVPDTADLLAEYDIQLDGQGELLEYSRQNRYVRGRPSE
ncbi:MAG: gas vesicle protein [Brevibacterium sp.]